MTNEKMDSIERCIYKFVGFHDCQITAMNIYFEEDSFVLTLDDVLFGLVGTADYSSGKGYLKFTKVDEMSIQKLSFENNYIINIKVFDKGESLSCEIAIGGNQKIEFDFCELEVWKGIERLG